MKLDDIQITRAILDRYVAKLRDSLEIGVALVGAGPANLMCGRLLGEAGVKAAVFESKLAPGGGMWGGGMMFNEIVVQEDAKALLERSGIQGKPCGNGLYTADSVEATASLIAGCVRAGTPIFNLIKVEDVMFGEEEGQKKISGLVIQWTPTSHMGLHVDPLTIRAGFVVDGTGHPAEICTILTRKLGVKLDTVTGGVVGEMPMWAERGEELTLANSGEIFPGLWVVGMAANAAKGAPRMGPIFGGMLMSGEKVARQLISLAAHG